MVGHVAERIVLAVDDVKVDPRRPAVLAKRCVGIGVGALIVVAVVVLPVAVSAFVVVVVVGVAEREIDGVPGKD